ncbi:ankyrin repeat-containing protein At5g02620-like [Coffea eugenioides]|uniref:ankyrin repeat-containing protein At5g02620-like n=1 Tax=Coffea eugenioides TaxID=49369 RepID=UPI000F610D9B|nr:ankyrin repeat-containing protein At5g02620-like [Coffea eugenioides]
MHPTLYAAAESGDWLVMASFSDYFYSQHTPAKDTVLHVLAQSCDSANVVQDILDGHGRLLMKLNKRGETALHLAARKGHSGVVRALIDYAKSGAGGYWFPPCFDRCKWMLRMASKAGNTALHEAVRNNFYDIAKLLVQEDPEFRYPHKYALKTPLYLAVEKGRHNIMVLILESCKTPSYLGPGHKTALHAAAIWNSPESMERILERLPNLIKNVDQFGWTALHYAAKFNHQHIARLLLSAKRSAAHVAAKNDDSKTALHIAASELINEMDKEGKTPLHLYVATKNLDGNCPVNHPFVDVNSFDDSNSTPLDRIVGDHRLSERQEQIKGQLQQTGAKAGIYNITAKRKAKASDKDLSDKSDKIPQAYVIVATVIVTVTFAAGFTVPGGFESGDGHKKGEAVLAKKAAFIVFVVSDSLALLLSMLVVFYQFVVRHRPGLFGEPSGLFSRKALIGYAMMAVVIAFMSGLFAVIPFHGIKIYLYVIIAFFGYFFLAAIVEWRVALEAGRSSFGEQLREQLRSRKENELSLWVSGFVDRLPYDPTNPTAWAEEAAQHHRPGTAAIRQLAYGAPADQLDEYIRMGETTAIECLS